MSTETARTPLLQTASEFSLGALIERLAALEETPPLRQLCEWLEQSQLTRAEILPFIGFKTHTYARHRVFRNEHAELLVLCWRPGQRTPIHDHNGSHGAIRVYEGVMWETNFTLAEGRGLAYHSGREVTAGQITGADVPDIHQIGNPEVSGQDLITLHLYAPPLTTINTYHLGDTTTHNSIRLDSWNPTI
jgi:cysteine dioxygenase